MNFDNTNLKTLKEMSFNKATFTKSVALSLSLFLGACAATGDKKEAPPPVKKVEQAVEQQEDQAPAPSAAELMKKLKAPVVAPPEEVAQPKAKAAPVASKPVETKQALEKKAAAAEAAAMEAKKQAELAKAAMVAAAEAEAKAKAAAEQAAVKPQPKPAVQEVAVKTEKGSSLVAKPFNISANKLPFNYDIWTIRKGNTPLTKGLVIATPTWEMGKEGYMSQIWLTMMEDKIHVNSSSDIETASKGLGIRIDGGDLIPFTSIAENNIGVIDGKWLDELASANKIDIYLGFFPGKKPTSDTFESDLSLDNLSRMVATYRMLNR